MYLSFFLFVSLLLLLLLLLLLQYCHSFFSPSRNPENLQEFQNKFIGWHVKKESAQTQMKGKYKLSLPSFARPFAPKSV